MHVQKKKCTNKCEINMVKIAIYTIDTNRGCFLPPYLFEIIFEGILKDWKMKCRYIGVPNNTGNRSHEQVLLTVEHSATYMM